ncbi:hypothetical protein VHEMI00954 [[Torrubiella] hemipterigena]|uniref:Uncharacterized protein n=1 Tax=[Torrubiella] hemipterigena TaxID=1531966 RepID=A0A0A1T624_9HYPO|nr:hypothetical protein VHEMI00954 [[Torrubiella] hemipterigena]
MYLDFSTSMYFHRSFSASNTVSVAKERPGCPETVIYIEAGRDSAVSNVTTSSYDAGRLKN